MENGDIKLIGVNIDDEKEEQYIIESIHNGVHGYTRKQFRILAKAGVLSIGNYRIFAEHDGEVYEAARAMNGKTKIKLNADNKKECTFDGLVDYIAMKRIKSILKEVDRFTGVDRKLTSIYIMNTEINNKVTPRGNWLIEMTETPLIIKNCSIAVLDLSYARREYNIRHKVVVDIDETSVIGEYIHKNVRHKRFNIYDNVVCLKRELAQT